MKPEKRMSAVARREQLLDLALAVVATEGFMGLSIDRVAQDAGVTRTLVYHQFATLDGLAMALVEREAEAAMRALTAIPAPDAADLQQAMTQFTAAVLAFGREAPLRWQVLLNPPDGGPPELHEQIARGRAHARGVVLEIVRARATDAEDIELTAHLLHVAIEELTRLHLRDPAQYPEARVLAQVRLLAAPLLHGAHPRDPKALS